MVKKVSKKRTTKKRSKKKSAKKKSKKSKVELPSHIVTLVCEGHGFDTVTKRLSFYGVLERVRILDDSCKFEFHMKVQGGSGKVQASMEALDQNQEVVTHIDMGEVELGPNRTGYSAVAISGIGGSVETGLYDFWGLLDGVRVGMPYRVFIEVRESEQTNE